MSALYDDGSLTVKLFPEHVRPLKVLARVWGTSPEATARALLVKALADNLSADMIERSQALERKHLRIDLGHESPDI